MGLPILKLLKGAVKLVIGKSAKKAGEEGVGILDVVEDVLNKDEEVQEALQNFIISFEGKYSELKTKFEGVVRTMLRPFLTVFFVVNFFVLVYLKYEIHWVIPTAMLSLIASWGGTKLIRDAKQGKKLFTK